MERIEPWFYSQFHCIAHRCSDTCCAGWDVYIDDTSLARYRGDRSAFGLYRQSKIVETEEGAKFALEESGRCPFLTETNLCTMIVEDGEASLCHICTHHPRFYKVYGGYDEQGIGLCCPEGSRLLLSQPLRFHRQTRSDDAPDDPMAQTLFELRGLLQEILLDTDMAFGDRCQEALTLAQQAQAQLYGAEIASAPVTKAQLWQSLLAHMMALEPIDQAWQQYVEGLDAQLPALLAGETAYLQSEDYDPNQYGNIAAYILYRHFPDALWDGAIVPRLLFALLGTLFVHVCYVSAWLEQGTLTREDREVHLKNWSKQVEYCEENTQLFLKACQEEAAFSSGWCV